MALRPGSPPGEFSPGLPPCPYHSSDWPEPNSSLPADPPAAPPPPPAPPPPSQPASLLGALVVKNWSALLPVVSPPHMVNTAIPGCPWVGSADNGVGLSMVLCDVQ